MTLRRLQVLRAHAEAGRHVTNAMALELIAHVDELQAAVAHGELRRQHRAHEPADCPECKSMAALLAPANEA